MIVKCEAQDNARGMLRERTPFIRVGDNLYYIVDGTLFLYDMTDTVYRYEEPINSLTIRALRELNAERHKHRPVVAQLNEVCNRLNADEGKPRGWNAEETEDSWFVLTHNGEEITQGYDFDVMARLKQIAKENQVDLS